MTSKWTPYIPSCNMSCLVYSPLMWHTLPPIKIRRSRNTGVLEEKGMLARIEARPPPPPGTKVVCRRGA